jgi:hypothetical protein
VSKRTTLGISIQPYNNRVLAVSIHCLTNKCHQVRKELGLLYDHKTALLVILCLQ